MHVRIAKYNKETNLYDELVLYRPGETYHYTETGEKVIDDSKYERVPIYTGRNSEMFSGMKEGDETNGYGDFPWTAIALSSLEPKLRKNIEEYMNSSGYFDFYELTLADMKLYLNDHPTVSDYDADNEKWDMYWENKGPRPQKSNPIQGLYENICNYISFADEWYGWNLFSSYKIIIYFDA